MNPEIARTTETTRQPGQPWSFIDAATFLGTSTKTLERGELAGNVRVIRFGRRKAIPDDEVRRLAAEGLSLGKGRSSRSHQPDAGDVVIGQSRNGDSGM